MNPERLTETLTAASPRLDLVAAAVASLSKSFVSEDVIVVALDGCADGAPGDIDGFLGHVFGTLGFRGNHEHYYAASNSLLHRVLETKLGNPLSIAMITAEVSRRAGLHLEPVGMPGHVIVGDGSHRRWFDPFAGGREMTIDDCEARFESLFPEQRFDPLTLTAMSATDVASRMLQNLRVAALRAGDIGALANVLRYRVAIPGASVDDRIELANVLGALGRYEQSAEQHDLLAALAPDNAERHHLAAVRQRAHNN